jgi:nicotinamidase-related amidase
MAYLDNRPDAALTLITRHMPVSCSEMSLAGRTAGLVVVDEVNGFATVGAGALAPSAPDAQISRMIVETDGLARQFVECGRPVAVLLDSHADDRPEPPYPPHCVRGTGEDELVPELAWLEQQPRATLFRKDCINGFVGSIDLATGSNRMIDWVNGQRLDTIVVVGICTDICVMDFVLTLLSARNHGMMPTLADIVVFEPGCATYDLSVETAASLGLPPSAAHPQALAHYLGLYFMASRGAILVDRWA